MRRRDYRLPPRRPHPLRIAGAHPSLERIRCRDGGEAAYRNAQLRKRPPGFTEMARHRDRIAVVESSRHTAPHRARSGGAETTELGDRRADRGEEAISRPSAESICAAAVLTRGSICYPVCY